MRHTGGVHRRLHPLQVRASHGIVGRGEMKIFATVSFSPYLETPVNVSINTPAKYIEMLHSLRLAYIPLAKTLNFLTELGFDLRALLFPLQPNQPS